MGVPRAPSKSTIGYINAHRGWRLFRDLYFKLLKHFNVKVKRIRIKRKIFIIDSTLISLCISLFDRALYRQRKGAIKIHTILDYEMGLPVFADLTEGRVSDIEVAREYVFPRGSVVLADRAYLDFEWLNNLDSMGVYFIIRLKDNILYQFMESYDLEVEAEYVLSDEGIKLLGQPACLPAGKPQKSIKRNFDWCGSKIRIPVKYMLLSPIILPGKQKQLECWINNAGI